MNLFNPTPADAAAQASQAPLADRMRPRALDEFVGQEHLLGPGKPLSLAIAHDDPTSMIFWGASRNRQDDAGQDHRRAHAGDIY